MAMMTVRRCAVLGGAMVARNVSTRKRPRIKYGIKNTRLSIPPRASGLARLDHLITMQA